MKAKLKREEQEIRHIPSNETPFITSKSGHRTKFEVIQVFNKLILRKPRVINGTVEPLKFAPPLEQTI
jgi:hypothetical protein